MGYVFMIVVGTVLGWQAAFMLRADKSRTIWRFIGAGIGGALVSGLLLAPRLSQGDLSRGTYTVDALLLTMVGAMAALMLAHVMHRRDLI